MNVDLLRSKINKFILSIITKSSTTLGILLIINIIIMHDC